MLGIMKAYYDGAFACCEIFVVAVILKPCKVIWQISFLMFVFWTVPRKPLKNFARNKKILLCGIFYAREPENKRTANNCGTFYAEYWNTFCYFGSALSM